MKNIKNLIQEFIRLNILTENKNNIIFNPENYKNITNIDDKFLDCKEYCRKQKL